MNKQVRNYLVIGVIVILLGSILVALPRECLLLSEEYIPLDFYPSYYSANFSVAGSDLNAELSLDFDISYGGNYSIHTVFWMLYQLSQEQFENQFNITKAHASVSGEDFDPDSYWAGWFEGQFSPLRSSIPSGAYVLVFWVVADELATSWSMALAISLWTSLIPTA